MRELTQPGMQQGAQAEIPSRRRHFLVAALA